MPRQLLLRHPSCRAVVVVVVAAAAPEPDPPFVPCHLEAPVVPADHAAVAGVAAAVDAVAPAALVDVVPAAAVHGSAETVAYFGLAFEAVLALHLFVRGR